MKEQTKNIILFDGHCKLCNGWANFVVKHDKTRSFDLVALQSARADALLKEQFASSYNTNTIILIKGKRVLTKSTAVLHILKGLEKGYPLLFGFIIIPRFLRDLVYSLMAKYRYRLGGKREECSLPTKE